MQPVDKFANGNRFGCRKPHGLRFALPVATFLRPIPGVPTAICLDFGVQLRKAEGLRKVYSVRQGLHAFYGHAGGSPGGAYVSGLRGYWPNYATHKQYYICTA